MGPDFQEDIVRVFEGVAEGTHVFFEDEENIQNFWLALLPKATKCLVPPDLMHTSAQGYLSAVVGFLYNKNFKWKEEVNKVSAFIHTCEIGGLMV